MSEDFLRNPASLFDVRGKTAIITGATGAFGALASKVLAGAISACKDYICRETLAVEIVSELPADLKSTAKVEIDGESLEIGLQRL